MISFRTDRCTLQTDVKQEKKDTCFSIDRGRYCVVLSLDVCLELQLWRARLLRCRNSSYPSFSGSALFTPPMPRPPFCIGCFARPFIWQI